MMWNTKQQRQGTPGVRNGTGPVGQMGGTPQPTQTPLAGPTGTETAMSRAPDQALQPMQQTMSQPKPLARPTTITPPQRQSAWQRRMQRGV